MLARVRTLVALDQRERLFGDRPHRFDIFVEAQIEHGSHVQAAFRGVRVPGAARPVPLEHFGQLGGVFGQMRQRYRAILNERHGFARVFHRHHDVEAGRADVGDGGLQRRIEHGHDATPVVFGPVPAKPLVAHQLRELCEAPGVVCRVLGEFNEQQRLRLALDELLHGAPEHRDIAREVDHGGIHQLDRYWPQRHDVLRHVHRAVERAEMADTKRAAAEQGPEFEFDFSREGERAFGTGQHVREIDRAVVVLGDEGIEIITADAALYLGKPRSDFIGFAASEGCEIAEQVAQGMIRRDVSEIGLGAPESGAAAVGQHGVYR